MTTLDQSSANALEGLADKPKSFGRLAWERFIHHRLAILGLVGLIVITLGFIVGPMINSYPFDKPDVLSRLQGPSREHWFGTDEIGRDLFVRTARGGRYSLAIGLLSAITATAIGTLIGSVAGYFGRAVDALIAQLINLFLVVPALALLAGLAMPKAVATSLLVVAMKSFAGLAGYIFVFGQGSFVSLNPQTQINWSVTLIITAAAIVGALIGSAVVGRIHPDKLRKAFGYFVLVMAVFILSQQIGVAVLDYARGGWLQAAEVIAGAIAIVAIFTWIIRRPAQVAVADFDEPIADSSTSSDKP